MPNLIPTFCVAMVLCRYQNRFLMIQEAKDGCRGQWSLPGGRIEPGEDVAIGVAREVKEEAGIVVEPTSILLVEHERMLVEGNWKERWRFVLDAKFVSGELKTIEDAESIRSAWLGLEEVPDLDLREERTTDYLRNFDKYQRLPITQYVYRISKY